MKNLASSRLRTVTLYCTLLVTAMASGPANTATKQESPEREYDFRGAVLGMPLAQFREMPFPDLSAEPKTKLFCSSDEETKNIENGLFFFLDSAKEAAGVVECRYYTPEYVGSGWQDAYLSIGTRGASKNVTYDFVPDPQDKIARLYSIVVSAYAIGASSAMDGLRGKFGTPTSVRIGTVQNRMGATFDHTSAVWANHLSMILFDNPSGDVDTMVIVYTEVRLSGYVEQTEKKIEGPSSSKM
ncbi:MAG TPA: hypothetical protein VHY79_06020 [Rhizomicrobium sp.]|nr:hypothetical protein [Rhizomicrobium sp.]